MPARAALRRPLVLALAAFLLLSVLDVATTLAALALRGAEGNALNAGVMRSSSPVLWGLGKVAVAVAFCLALIVLHRRLPHVALAGAGVAALVYAAVVANNAVQVAALLHR